MNKYIYNLGILFNEIASGNKSAPAITMTDGSVTSYDRLNTLSNQIARFIINKNILTGNVAAIFNDKSIEAYAIMIACLKTGVIYTNLDTNSPVDRINKMIDISKPSIFFTNTINITKITSINHYKHITVDYKSEEFIIEINKLPTEFLKENSSVTGNTPAYLMFTSGSTGFPKGVIITHSNVLNFIEWSKLTYNITPSDLFTNINPMHFDNSVFDFYSSIFTGACMIPVSEDLTKNPRKLFQVLNKVNPTIWFSVPSMLVYALKLRAVNEPDLPSLRIVSFGGEGFPKNQLRNLWNIWGKRVKFINVYGPTECTCICSSYEVTQKDIEKDELLPLGPMAPNFGHIISDDGLKQVSGNEAGELWISGPNVGLGYYNNPEKTNEVFIQNPFINTHRDIIYKSGDLVRYDKVENLLYFCGRKDNQIKRMGYRIELEEIENALGSLVYIEENAVIYIDSADNIGKIIACVRSINTEEFRIISDLEKLIPSYMLPSEFKFYDHLPKNQNGKIDRLQLKMDFAE
jgi:D-alanine--poly(phosphoribitol) ligase subunit 1